MLIGNGLIAEAFSEYADNSEILIFASGVSNSKETRISEFDREKKLLLKSIKGNAEKLLVYFSTTSVYDSSLNKNAYILHKKSLEKIITDECDDFLIIRTSNVVGQSNNQNTLLNFLVSSVVDERKFELWGSAYRNLIDIDDLREITNKLIESPNYHNKIVNVANTKQLSVISIVREIEDFFKVKGRYKILNIGTNFEIDISEIREIIEKLEIDFDNNYVFNLLNKYYSYYATKKEYSSPIP